MCVCARVPQVRWFAVVRVMIWWCGCDVGYCCRRYEPRPEDLTEAQRVTVAMGVPLKVTKSFSSLTALLPEPTAAAAAAAGKKKTKKKTKSKKKNNNKQKQEL